MFQGNNKSVLMFIYATYNTSLRTRGWYVVIRATRLESTDSGTSRSVCSLASVPYKQLAIISPYN